MKSMNSEKSIQILNASHAEQYTFVQSASLSAAKGFIARPETYQWFPEHEIYPTLGAFHGGQLISVMRLEWISSWPELNAKMHSSFFHPGLKFPCAYLTKGGTLPEFMGLGLNSLLRYHALKISMHWQVGYILGTMIKGSSRVESMKQMGYEFSVNPVKWKGYYQSEENALIGYLNLPEKGLQALNYLEDRYIQLLLDYKPKFNPYDVKIKVPFRSVS